METRKVIIVNNKTQCQYVLQESRATTLGELKRELDALNISYEGLTFYEGHSKTELMDDESPLPSNIPFKGQVTNDLAFLLTVPDKKITSGTMKRAEAYNLIKSLSLAEECRKRYGKNFTQCPTSDLVNLIKEKQSQTASVSAPVKKEKKDLKKISNKAFTPVEKALITLMEDLFLTDVISEATYNKVTDTLGKAAPVQELSKEEIDDLFGFIER